MEVSPSRFTRCSLSVSASPLVLFVDFRLEHSDVDSVYLAQSLLSVIDSFIVDPGIDMVDDAGPLPLSRR